MDSLVGYGSDDENETERYGAHSLVAGGGAGAGGSRRADDGTNYDDVNMDLSERRLHESQGAESEPELPPALPAHHSKGSDDSRDRDRGRDRDSDRDRAHVRRGDRGRDPGRDPDRRRGPRGRDRSPRRDDKFRWGERGALGERRDRTDDRTTDAKVPALMELKPFGREPPPAARDARDARGARDAPDDRDARVARDTHDVRDPRDAPDTRDARVARDMRDAVSPRFTERDHRDRGDKDRERERDRDRHTRRSEERKSERERSRSRGAGGYPPPATSSCSERRGSPSAGDYRPSYKVNKKLEVMEKMGLQIKTPDGSMATAQQLRRGAGAQYAGYVPGFSSTKMIDQKRKLLWSNKNKSEAEEAAKWSGAKFSQDNDGKQMNKFMRLMGIKETGAVKPEASDKSVDPVKNQEELFQAMQAQYEVARATTHTMRGVGLGFQRGQF